MSQAVAYDLEMTGTDTATDAIVEIAIVDVETTDLLLATRVHPGRPIPLEASAVHGITDADVANKPPFSAIAAEVQHLIAGARLVGYSSRSFDTLILDRQLREAGCEGIDLNAVEEIDLLAVWKDREPRTLASALWRYCRIAHVDAHGAVADAQGVVQLYHAIRKAHGLHDADMLLISRPPDEVDRSGKLRHTDEGKVVFAFGTHEGDQVLAHLDYVDWMRRKNFPSDTMRAVDALLAVRNQRHDCTCGTDCHQTTNRPVCPTCAVCAGLRAAGVSPNVRIA